MQVHHIIPRALVGKAKAICPSFDLDGADNLIALPTADYKEQFLKVNGMEKHNIKVGMMDTREV
ncbi:hypothetical protein [Acinetobacter gerneri]|uniref:hypothetical protein n=1 Tax=Acinetobacter gerneri TaxID=202952 RepID=UPI0032144124